MTDITPLDPALVDRLVDRLLDDGVAVADADALPGAPDDALWSAIGALPHGTADVPRWHVYLKEQFKGFTVCDDTLGGEAAHAAEAVATAAAGWLAQIAERLVVRGVLPGSATAPASWSSNITRWDASAEERMSAHVDWEMLTVVLSPDASLVTSDGDGPTGHVAVFVVGDLGHRFSGGRVPVGVHRVSAGPLRRSMQVFMLGNPDVCSAHGLLHPCGPTVRDVLAPQYADEIARRRVEDEHVRDQSTPAPG